MGVGVDGEAETAERWIKIKITINDDDGRRS